MWDREAGGYCDPDTGRPLPHWDEALDELDDDPDAKPAHVVRFGQQTDIKGLLAGTKDSERAVGYLCKYLTKSVADTYADPATSGLTEDQHAAYEAHIDRLARAGALAALLAGVRELAALRHPARRPPAPA